MPHRIGALALCGLVVACSGAPDSDGSGGLEIVRDTVGDTVVVRTISGSEWGGARRMVPEVSIGELDGDPEYLFGQIASVGAGPDGRIYVLDRQGPDLRAYDANGVFLRTLAEEGGGPGELESPGALTVLTDGRVLVRDPGNARIQVFEADGTVGPTWPLVRGGFYTSSSLWWDRRDNVYLQILLDPQADVSEWQRALVRVSADGAPLDTLRQPDVGYETSFVELRLDGATARYRVPFSPTEEWMLHPDGFFVHGVSSDYRFTLLAEGAPVRVERVYEPVAVQAGEASQGRDRITSNMRSMKPDWTWDGPPVPREKPAYSELVAARDGRIWVQVHAPGVESPNPDHDPQDESSRPTRWGEPVVYDVFAEDGRYLGRVDAPEGFRTYPVPFIDGAYVWAVTGDDLGVERVVRFRVEPTEGGGG